MVVVVVVVGIRKERRKIKEINFMKKKKKM
jgi:hypothetical protein